MKKYLLLFALACLPLFASAQTATRPIVLTWVDSTSTTVTGYSIYVCVASATTPCTPSTTGVPALTATATATSAVYMGTIGNFYSIVIVANAPACGSSITTACGNSSAVSFSPNPIAVPPQTASASNPQSSVP